MVVLKYPEGKKVVTIKCCWFDIDKSVKVDNNRIVTVDIKLNSDDVFVLASQECTIHLISSILEATGIQLSQQ